MSETHKKPAPFSLRLSPEERSQLEHFAAGLSLGEYIRQRLFDESMPKRRSRGKFPVKDHVALSQLLGELGGSRMPNNLNQLAKAANTGTLVLTSEVRATLLEASADIAEMRKMLMRALGLGD
ncbi:MAG: MobC family plasmid mobilization relaxosome protein [Candidatus Polarisedimenticolaceae bacterium]|nr:MobC family plasmid mobilization relaxosome protein [Candidatus Polarisedimenticolaceae bacterium]